MVKTKFKYISTLEKSRVSFWFGSYSFKNVFWILEAGLLCTKH